MNSFNNVGQTTFISLNFVSDMSYLYVIKFTFHQNPNINLHNFFKIEGGKTYPFGKFYHLYMIKLL